MDEKYRIFWKEIIDYNYKLQKMRNTDINILHILALGNIHLATITILNNYLNSKSQYDQLKSNLQKANITFSAVNATDLPEKINKKQYDLVLLSNVFDYFYRYWNYGWKFSELEKYIESLQKIVKKDGIIFLFYIFTLECRVEFNDFVRIIEPINNACVYFDDFKNMDIYSFGNPYSEDISGIVLKKC